MEKIIIRGAREHNLKNVSLELPRNKLIVMTGMSGSGKSSLAIDTLYAEGERRYVESLSAYARQFLGQMNKPDVDSIEGLSPAVCIDQKGTTKNPRSTVGTITEIYDYLRVLYARVGVPHCPVCGTQITQQTAQQIIEQILGREPGTKLSVLAPVVRGRKGEYRDLLERLRREGYVRVKIDGKVYGLEENIKLDKQVRHDIDVVVDRLVIKEGVKRRLADSVETALKLADGIIAVETGPDRETYSTHFACLNDGFSFGELSPRIFSFNAPYGACPECDGLGTRIEPDIALIVPDPEKSLEEGAVAPYSGPTINYYPQMIRAVACDYGIDLDKPWKDLKKDEQDVILYGTGGRKVYVKFRSMSGYTHAHNTSFEGVMNNLTRRYKETDSDYAREKMEEYMSLAPCPACQGARLKKESLAVTVGGINIVEMADKSSRDLMNFLDELQLPAREAFIAERLLKEIKRRVKFLVDVGLDYLTINRAAATLAGGEAQRIRLATQIGSGLVGVLYVLDEPSIGLHQRDNQRLLETLKALRDLGNTLVVVEHDEATIRNADYIVDIGPAAGEHGGRIIAQGTLAEILANPESLTGKYLTGERKIAVPSSRRHPAGETITVVNPREHNLKGMDISFPLGMLICVTGVSGSGKSTLVDDILWRSIARKLYRSRVIPGAHDDIVGLEQIDKAIEIDQSPIGRTPRSNPATYIKAFDEIRKLFAETQEARLRGYKPGRFSFNVSGGRCENCRGDGQIKIEMHFLPDVYVECEVCKGRRYNNETLEIRFKGRNVAEVLDMSVEEALKFFEKIPPIRRKLDTINDVGLGYIKLGQPAPTLSGGEAQRVKLSAELSKRATGRTLYILDEPTTGLHFADIDKLLEVLNRLVDQGNTIIVIEHNLDVIKKADWLVDLGPEGGEGGGEVVAEGTPEQVAKTKGSYTGKFLKQVLKKK
ncbi:MAG: excinuclease ABC subunit UvrA [Actinomycetota bacterium]